MTPGKEGLRLSRDISGLVGPEKKFGPKTPTAKDWRRNGPKTPNSKRPEKKMGL